MFLEINSRRILLEPGHLYMLGKQINAISKENDKRFIQLEDKGDIDKKHCIIEISHSEDVYIFDLFSSQGTLLNNQPLTSLNKTPLKNSDIIKLGNQEIKFFHDRDQQEVSHDSSGFLDVNRNTSDIVNSSPEYTSQRENRIKRLNNNNFLVPPIPNQKSSSTLNTSAVRAETEINNATNNSQHDSFTIPETQYCRPRTSINSSDLSIAESISEGNASKIKFNFGNLDDEDDEFCIPETQEPIQISDSQRLRILVNDKKPEEPTVVEENTADLEAEGSSTKDLEGSQFRISTQEYNEGFGEEMGSIHSQIIPIIKHNVTVLNASSVSSKNVCERRNKDDKEISSVKWSHAKDDQETTNLRADCSTPDIFELSDMEQNKKLHAEKEAETKEQNILEEDEEDLLPTQVFSLQKIKLDEKILNDIDNPCLEKENEEILTSSDKENKCPVALEPITDLPPTQLFATNEVSTTRSTLSNSSRSGISSAHKTCSFAAPTNISSSNAPAESKKNSKLLLNLDPDEEDDLLTQAFLLPANSNLANTTNKHAAIKCFNSTLLDEKFVDKNAATFFAEMDKTPLKQSSSLSPTKEKELSVVKKTSSAISTTSETDLDLLMCTPQLIKEHLQVGIRDDLRKNILAAKNKNLFGDDTDEEEINNDPIDLVKLINVPKVFKDFDKLLPHLKNEKQHSNEKAKQKAEKDAQKEYKFNISFGKEIESQQTSTSKSTNASRDERHMARDRERELAELKEKLKSETKQNERRDKRKNTVEKNNPDKLERTTRNRKRLASTDKFDVAKEDEIKKPRESKQKKSVEKGKLSTEEIKNKELPEAKNKTKTDDSRKTKETTKTKKLEKEENSSPINKEKDNKKTDNEINSKHVKKQIPARQMKRSKSINEDSTSKEAINNNKAKASQSKVGPEDDLDSVSTQPFVRITRGRSNSKNGRSEASTNPNSSLSKSTNESKGEKSSADRHKTLNERKRKTEPPPAKVERKRLRSTHSQELRDSKVYISMTMVDPELFKELAKDTNELWSIATNPAESDILVMDKAFRTFKFLLAMARGIPIVTSEYLRKINELQSVKKVCVTDYLFSDAEFEKRHKFSLIKSLQLAKKQKLFKDYEFLMTPNIVPNPSEIKAIIEASGGLVHVKSPPVPKENQQIYLVSSAEDKKDWHKYRRLNKNITIISTEAIMTSIMRQTCARLSSYTLS